MKKQIHVLMLSLCLLLAGAAQAKEFNNVQVHDEIQLEGASPALKLNGVGMRSKFFFDIYIGALYLVEKTNSLDGVLSQSGAKRVLMHFVYDEVPAEKLVAGWNEGFQDNLSDEQLNKLAERIDLFNAMFETVHAGDIVLLDYLPGQGTRVTIKGEVKGMIEGEDFNRALLKIWLGDEPADEALKEAMLNVKD